MTIAIRRGCGKRTAGGIYLVTEFSVTGLPLRLFLYDPPWVPMTDEGDIWYPGVQGMSLALRPSSEVYDVWDWIGAENYPYFPDFWEEGRRFEFSRKMPPSTAFELLEVGKSQTIGVHPKGLWASDSPEELAYIYGSAQPDIFSCPHGKSAHEYYFEHSAPYETPPVEFCTALLWQMVDVVDEGRIIGPRDMPRGLKKGEEPTFTYVCASIVPELSGHWMPAAVYHLPIHAIEIINDPLEGKHEESLDIVASSGTNMPYRVVDA